MNTQDRRIKKTQLSIRTALMNLMKTKPFSQISVTEVATLANINRKSFYNHYNTLQDVLLEFENEIVEHIFSLIKTNSSLPYEFLQSPIPVFKTILNYFISTPDQINLIIEAGEFPNLLCLIGEHFKHLIFETPLKEKISNPALFSLYIDFITGGICSVVSTWYKKNNEMTLDEFSMAIEVFLKNNSPDHLPFVFND